MTTGPAGSHCRSDAVAIAEAGPDASSNADADVGAGSGAGPDAGSGTVLMLAVVMVAGLMVAASCLLGQAAIARHRAQAAADLAAIAGAGAIGRSGNLVSGCRAAGETARANLNELQSCSAGPGGDIMVTTSTRPVSLVLAWMVGHGSARAGPAGYA
jgi:secretion/DNA translocation related TadE-like protein